MDELDFLKNLNLGTEEEQDPTLVAQQTVQQPDQQSVVPDLNKIETPAVPTTTALVSKELDPRLVEALKQRSDTRQSADLLRTFQQLIQAGATGTGYKADTSMADSIERRANDPVDIYKLQSQQEAAAAKAQQDAEKTKMFVEAAKMKLKEANIKIEDTKLGKDPTSRISRSSQEIAKMYMDMTGKPYNKESIENMSGDELVKMIPGFAKLATEYIKDQHLGSKLQESSRLKERELDLKEKELGAKIKEKEEKQSEKLSEGEKVIDREFAKKYNDWRTGGKADYEENKKIFVEAIGALGKDLETGKKIPAKVSTGTASGVGARIPVVRTDTRELETRVRKAINGMLRATLGAQFTEQEGERIFNQTFDPFADASENIKNMETELAKIQKRADAFESQGQFFVKNKSLRDYPVQSGSPSNQQPQTPGPGSIINSGGKRYRVGADGESLEEIK